MIQLTYKQLVNQTSGNFQFLIKIQLLNGETDRVLINVGMQKNVTIIFWDERNVSILRHFSRVSQAPTC